MWLESSMEEQCQAGEGNRDLGLYAVVYKKSHFGLPPSAIHTLTGLGGKKVEMMTHAHKPHIPNKFENSKGVGCRYLL